MGAPRGEREICAQHAYVAQARCFRVPVRGALTACASRELNPQARCRALGFWPVLCRSAVVCGRMHAQCRVLLAAAGRQPRRTAPASAARVCSLFAAPRGRSVSQHGPAWTRCLSKPVRSLHLVPPALLSVTPRPTCLQPGGGTDSADAATARSLQAQLASCQQELNSLRLESGKTIAAFRKVAEQLSEERLAQDADRAAKERCAWCR